MSPLTTVEIDRELSSRTTETAAMSATLVELDSHPGLAHVRLYPPTGRTATQWVVVQAALTQLWEDLAHVTSILESARAVRARGSKLDDDERSALTTLLRDRPLEVSRTPIPLAQRQIAGPGESVAYVGLADTTERMRAAYPAVVEFLDAVDRIDSLVAERLTPVQKRLEAAGAGAPKEIAELLAISATDPLSLTIQDIENRVGVIAELAVLHVNWDQSVAAAASRLDALRDAVTHAAQTRAHAMRSVLAGALPDRADPEPELRTELTSIDAPDPAALRALSGRIEAALSAVGEDAELAQGLLDRRTELKGRISAYEAKAARLGLGEDRDLLASSAIATGLLSRKPCDLRAATRAVADYQQMLLEKREKSQ